MNGLASKYRFYFLLMLIGLIVLFIVDILVGSVSIPFSTFFSLINGEEVEPALKLIILESRLPKALTAILCGASLSLAGLLMQTLFRNPLAGPYILGISSGAGLGVAILVMGAGLVGISVSSTFGLSIAALLGAIAILFILFLVSLKVKDVMTLLIFGVMIGSIATAIIGIIQYLTTDYQLKSFLLWTMGSLSSLSGEELKIMLSILIIALITALAKAKSLNSILVGEDFASSLGINIRSSRLVVILISGALAGIVTAFCGPIGFVGIVIPHLCRLLFKSTNHFILIPTSVLLGANVLLLSDIISHLPTNGMSLPINSITSIIGIPIIIWMVFGKKSISKSF